MLRRFLKDSFAYSAANILSHLVSLLLLPLFTRVLSPAEYGVSDILQAAGSVMRILIPLEISQALARYYAGTKDELTKTEYASTAFVFTAIVWILYTFASFLFSVPFSNLLLGDLNWAGVFRWQTLALALNGIFFLLQLQSRYDFRTKDFVVSSLAFVIVSSIVSALTILLCGSGIRGMYYGQVAGSLFGSIFALGRGWHRFLGGFKFRRLRELLIFSGPLVPASLSVFIAAYIDRFAIQRYMTLADVGVYGIAIKFSSLMSLLLVGVASALNPLIYSKHEDPSTPVAIERIFRFFLIAGSTILCGFALFSVEAISVFTTPEFFGAASVMPILVLSAFLGSLPMFSPGILLAKRTKVVAFITALSAALATLLNFILVPVIGIAGAALSNVIASGLKAAAYSLCGKKYYPIHYGLRSFAFLVAPISGSFLYHIIGSGKPWNNFIARAFAFVFFSLAGAWLVGGKELISLISGIRSRARKVR